MKRVLWSILTVVVIVLFAVIGYYVYDVTRQPGREKLLAEISHAEDIRKVTPMLSEALEHPNPEIRGRAAIGLGRIDAPDAGRTLLGMLADSSEMVARQTAFALGLTDQHQYADDLLDVAIDLPATLLPPVIEAAGRLADTSQPDVVSQLITFLSHPAPQVRAATCRALFYTGDRSVSSAVVDMAVPETDRQVRLEALYLLARFQETAAEQLFVFFLADPDPFARQTAVRGLGHIEGEQAEHYLAIALNDRDPSVVARAVRELGQRTSARARDQLARKLGDETDPRLIRLILESMIVQDNSAGVEVAHRVLAGDYEYGLIGTALKYLAVFEKQRAIALVDSVAHAGNSYLRAACAEAYGQLQQSNLVPRMAVLFNDEDPLVRRVAFENLTTIDAQNRRFYIDKALNDPDFAVVAQAVEQIKTFAFDNYLTVLATMMSMPADTDVDVRRAIVETAAFFLEQNTQDSTALQILIDGIMDPQYVVRRDAADVYDTLLDENRYKMVPPAPALYSVGKIENAYEKYQRNPFAEVVTTKGIIKLELLFDAAPLTVMNFVELAGEDFYRGLLFHRVIPGFVAQGGCPRGDGWGGPGYFVRSEHNDLPYERGAVGMATSGKDTGGSQFFITLSPQPHLEANYTLFARVIDGMDVAEQLVEGDMIESITVVEGAI
jgi:cyclophilin family peptidyl-prolyl cis-trans isomerase/HEAT repeat protein